MSNLKAYKIKLFFIVSFSMIFVAVIVMMLGYFASKNSTIRKIEQSAQIEMRLKKEILNHILNSSKQRISMLKNTQLYKKLRQNKTLSKADIAFFNNFFMLNTKILSIQYRDQNGKKVGFFHNEKQRKLLGTDKIVSMQAELNSLQKNTEVALVGIRKISEKVLITLGFPFYVDDKTLASVLIEINFSSWSSSFLNSPLFKIALIDKEKNLIASNGLKQEDLISLKQEKAQHAYQGWKSGHLYKAEKLLSSPGANINMIFKSKESLGEITDGIAKIFLISFFIIIILSIGISYFLTTYHMKLFKKIMTQEDLLIQESKLLEIGGMISYLAHQWKQPINTIGTGLMALGKKISKGEHKDCPETIEHLEYLVQGLGEDIENFRNFYRFSQEETFFSAKDGLEEIMRLIKPHLFLKNIVVVHESDKDFKIYGFKNEWLHAVLSIINNMVEAYDEKTSHANKMISFELQETSTHSLLRIRDFAGGIKKEIKNKIFEKYSSSKKNKDSTGMGLYFARVIIEDRIGGKISFETDSKGTTFTITHPIVEDKIN